MSFLRREKYQTALTGEELRSQLVTMASTPTQVKSALAPAIEVSNMPLKTSPSEEPVSTNQTDTPPNTPGTGSESPMSLCAALAIENIPGEAIVQPLHDSRADPEADDKLNVEQSIEHIQPPSSTAGVKSSGVEAPENMQTKAASPASSLDVTVIATNNEDDTAAEKSEFCEPRSGQLDSHDALSADGREVHGLVEADGNKDEVDEATTAVVSHVDNKIAQVGVSRRNDGESSGDDEDTVVDAEDTNFDPIPELPQSAPSHMRPSPKLIHVQSTQENRVSQTKPSKWTHTEVQ